MITKARTRILCSALLTQLVLLPDFALFTVRLLSG